MSSPALCTELVRSPGDEARVDSRPATRRLRRTALACAALLPWAASAIAAVQIPATPLMTVYQFDGPLELPYQDASRFGRDGTSSRAGTLTQGSSVIPCLVLRDGRPLTDREGTPYVGFEVVVDAARATPDSTVRFKEIASQRKTMTVENHHCPPGTRHVIDIRKLHALDKPPFFDPPRPPESSAQSEDQRSELDAIVRAFHASPRCESANRSLLGRRDALRRAWDGFLAENARRWPSDSLARGKRLDYVMRTAIYEGHLERGCSAYGACERNVIALSIRNRGLEHCLSGQGCRFEGDFEGVASTVSQYNIWDEYLTQISGLTACFLRPDLAGHDRYAKLQAMYEQSVPEVERILFGGELDLERVFPGVPQTHLRRLRHYYHPPAMGKCFPHHPRLEYITGAIAERGDQFALIAGVRVQVDAAEGRGYLFREASIAAEPTRDVVTIVDRYPGYVIDGRKIQLQRPTGCTPYGVPRDCDFSAPGRHRKTPSWLSSGAPLELTCRVQSRGEDCRSAALLETARVGGSCDIEMQPTAGVP